MQQISTKNMREMLDVVKGAAMVGLIAVTDPYGGKPLKKARADCDALGLKAGDPNPFLSADAPDGCALVKVQRGHGMFNCKYNKAVEKRVAARINADRVAAGELPLEGAALTEAVDERFRKGDNWQQVVVREDGSLTPFAEHKGNGTLYLRTMFYKSIGEPTYIDIRDGKLYKFTDIEAVLPTKSVNKNQGLPEDEVVRYNVWKLEGIRGMRLNGGAYRVRPAIEREAESVFAVLNGRLAEIDIPEPPSIGDDGLPQ
jgi:hypothetical protein